MTVDGGEYGRHPTWSSAIATLAHRIIDSTLRQVRYSLRGLVKSPVFSLTAILILAIGIGGVTAVFALLRATLLKPLPYPAPDELVYVDQRVNLRRYEETSAAVRTLASLGAFLGMRGDMVLSGDGAPQGVRAARVTANFLDVLGVQPLMGRGFLDEEDRETGQAATIISAGLWQTRYGADASALGKTVLLDAVPHVIVGVVPEGFSFPFAETDVWVTRPADTPFMPRQYRRRLTILTMFGRLAPGMSIEQAQSEIDVLNQQLRAENPRNRGANAELAIIVRPLAYRYGGAASPLLWTLFGAVAFVLLIACANIAGLILTRASARAHEYSVRSALGESVGRFAASMLTESALVTFGGSAAGVALAGAAAALLPSVMDIPLLWSDNLEIDAAALAVAVTASILVAVPLGLLPAMRLARRIRPDALSGHGSVAVRTMAVLARRFAGFRAQELLVVAQIAMSVALLAGAISLLQSFARLLSVDLGFQSRNLLTMKLSLPEARYETAQQRASFYAALDRRLSAIVGIQHAALMRSIPTTPTLSTNVSVVGRPSVPLRDQLKPFLQCVTPGYFATLGIPLVRGRAFLASDDHRDAPPTILINESLARHFWPTYPQGPDPVGQRMSEGADRIAAAEIVGIVGDMRQRGLAGGPPQPEFYVPMALHAPQVSYLAARVNGNRKAAVSMIREAVVAVDPHLALLDVRTMEQVLRLPLGRQRLATLSLSAFALIAVLLAALGVHGVTAHSVVERSGEFALRRALGGNAVEIVRLVLRRVLRMAATGIAIGIAMALALGRVIASLFFEASSSEIVTLALAALLILASTVGASTIPVLRAVSIPPIAGLQER